MSYNDEQLHASCVGDVTVYKYMSVMSEYVRGSMSHLLGVEQSVSLNTAAGNAS